MAEKVTEEKGRSGGWLLAGGIVLGVWYFFFRRPPAPPKLYVCHICDEQFATTAELDAHLALVHGELPPPPPPTDVEITDGKLTKVVDGYQAHYFVKVMVRNNTDITFRSADGTRLIAHVLRPSDRRLYGAYPYPPGYVDIPRGTKTFSWDFWGLSHWGMEKIVLPDPLDYILEIGLSLYDSERQVAFIVKEFPGTIALG